MGVAGFLPWLLLLVASTGDAQPHSQTLKPQVGHTKVLNRAFIAPEKPGAVAAKAILTKFPDLPLADPNGPTVRDPHEPPGGDGGEGDEDEGEALPGKPGAGSGPSAAKLSKDAKAQGTQCRKGHGPPRFGARHEFSVTGLTVLDVARSNDGQQPIGEPPDQALCVGGGFLVEGVNNAVRVYRAKDGKPLSGIVDLNTFFGYPPAQSKKTGQYGPVMADPVCLYDRDVKRFFFAAFSQSVDPTTREKTGKYQLDIAVSKSSDPTKGWHLYWLPVQNDGTEGTPNHGFGPLFGDYPQIGHDAHAFYITSNDFAVVANNIFVGSSIYAMDKRALASGVASTPSTGLFLSDQYTSALKVPAFTLQPTILPADQPYTTDGRTYLLSSLSHTGKASRELLLWTLSGTDSLRTSSPKLKLEVTTLDLGRYYQAPRYLAYMKNGQHPLGTLALLFDNSTQLRPGLNPGDGRMLSHTLAAGRLWGALGTPVLDCEGKPIASGQLGALIVQVDPRARRLLRADVIAATDQQTDVIYPALAVNSKGKGIVGLTLSGLSDFPSTAYALLDQYGMSTVTVALPGKAPQDGFTQYISLSPKARWGDYGAATVDERGDVYFAAEYIAAACTASELASFPLPQVGQCHNTRTFDANWATGITKLRLRRSLK